MSEKIKERPNDEITFIKLHKDDDDSNQIKSIVFCTPKLDNSIDYFYPGGIDLKEGLLNKILNRKKTYFVYCNGNYYVTPQDCLNDSREKSNSLFLQSEKLYYYGYIKFIFYDLEPEIIKFKTQEEMFEFLNYLSSKVRVNYSDYTCLSKLQNLYEFIVDRDFSN